MTIGDIGAQVAGLGTALPARVVSNAEATAHVDADDEWVRRRTGITERRWAAPDAQLADLAAEAGRCALVDANLSSTDVDLLLVATFTADHLAPHAAPLVADALGLGRAGAIDVGAACAGFVSALTLGGAMIEARRAARVLVIGAEILSRHTDGTDRQTAALFGDGAGAIVLEATQRGRLGPAVLGADGARSALIVAPRSTGLIAMNGHEVFQHAVARMRAATLQACAAAELTLADVDLFVFHQANARILASLAHRLGLPEERVVEAIAHTGNTSSASIPLALEHARQDGRLRHGSRVLLAAFGAGFVWSAVTLTWGRGG